MVDIEINLKLNKEELKKLMVFGEVHLISKNLDSEVRLNIKFKSRVLIPPNEIDERFPL